MDWEGILEEAHVYMYLMVLWKSNVTVSTSLCVLVMMTWPLKSCSLHLWDWNRLPSVYQDFCIPLWSLFTTAAKREEAPGIDRTSLQAG